jgi:hypothetical protein
MLELSLRSDLRRINVDSQDNVLTNLKIPNAIWRYGYVYTSYPPLDPQHPQHIGQYDAKLMSDPQQSRNKGATEGATGPSLHPK